MFTNYKFDVTKKIQTTEIQENCLNVCLKKLLKRTKPKYFFSLDLMSENNAFFVHRNLRGKQGLCVIGPLRVGSC